MLKKKPIKNWQAALLHCMVGGFVIPIFLRNLFFLLFLGIYGRESADLLLYKSTLGTGYYGSMIIFVLLFDFLPFIIGIFISLKIMNRLFLVNDRIKMVRISVFFYVVFMFFLPTAFGDFTSILIDIRAERYIFLISPLWGYYFTFFLERFLWGDKNYFHIWFGITCFGATLFLLYFLTKRYLFRTTQN